MENEIKAAFDELRELWLSEFEKLDGRIDEKTAAAIVEAENALHKRMDVLDLAQQGLEHERANGGGIRETSAGPFVYGAETKAASYFDTEPLDVPVDEVRVGALMAGAAFGQHVIPYMREAEQKTFLTTPGAQGGFVVPDAISAAYIDEIRNKAQVFRAGAATFGMRANTVNLPALEGTVAGWRGEGAAFPDAGGSFRNRQLVAKMVAASSEVSIEALEDAGADGLESLSALLESAQARAIASALDEAVLVGAGGVEPTGLFNLPGVTKTPLTAAPSDYAFLVSAIGRCRQDNFEPGAAIYSARTAEALDLLTDTTGQPLRPPRSVERIELLDTNAVPDDLGAGSNESSAFVADWSRVIVGLRPSMNLRVQVDPYSAGDSGLVRIRSYMRGDVLLLDDGAAEIVTEILP